LLLLQRLWAKAAPGRDVVAKDVLLAQHMHIAAAISAFTGYTAMPLSFAVCKTLDELAGASPFAKKTSRIKVLLNAE